MPRASELLGTPADPTPEAGKLLRATVLDVGPPLRVTVPALSDKVVVVEHSDGAPSVGDKVLVAFDEDGDEWVVAGGPLQPFLSVKDPAFRATGDGTTDDTLAIQAAIDAASATGRGLFFPRGDYLVEGLVWDHVGGVMPRILGEAQQFTKLVKAGTSTDPILKIGGSVLGAIYAEVEELTFYGNNGASAHDGLELVSLARATLRRVGATRCRRGIYSNGSILFALRDSALYSNLTGFYARVGSGLPPNMVTLESVRITSNTTLGIDWAQGSGLILRGCDFEANGTTDGLDTGAARLDAFEPDSLTSWVLIDGCWFEQNLGRTLNILDSDGTSQSESTILSSYFVSNEDGRDLYVDGLARFNMVAGQALSPGGTVEIADTRTVGMILNAGIANFVDGGSSVAKMDAGGILNASITVDSDREFQIRNGADVGGIRRDSSNRIVLDPLTDAAGTAVGGDIVLLPKNLRIAAQLAAASAVNDSLFIDSADGQFKFKNAAGSVVSFAAGAHTHVESDITGLVADLAAKQPLDSDLTAIAALSTTVYGRSLLEAANAAALRTLAGLVIGTDVQGYDAELAALAGLTSAADKGIQFTGAGTAGTYDLTAAGKALLDDADASAQLTTLGVSAFVKTLLDDADAATARATLGKVVAADETGLKTIRGIVTTVGGGASVVEGTGFTVSRNGTGDITVDFTTDFSDVPAVTAMLGQGSFQGGVVPSTGGIVAGSARLISFEVGVGARDSIVHFIAVGPA